MAGQAKAKGDAPRANRKKLVLIVIKLLLNPSSRQIQELYLVPNWHNVRGNIMIDTKRMDEVNLLKRMTWNDCGKRATGTMVRN